MKEAFRDTALPEISPQKNEPSEPSVWSSGRDPFDVDRVIQLLDGYIAATKPEIAVSVALKAHAPVLDGETILISVDNPLQLEKTEALKSHLLNILMQQLNNSFIRLEFRLCNGEVGQDDDRKLITGQDKLDFFIRQNPAVLELKKVFGLELD